MKIKNLNPAFWISSLYFSEGIPAAIICEISIVLFASLGAEPESITKYVSLLGLPWVFKPIWSPVVDLAGSKKMWIIFMQLLLGAIFAAAGWFAAPGEIMLIFALFAAGAFLSATHDIAADGFYIVALNNHQQSLYSGIRSVFYRAAMIAANGGILWIAAANAADSTPKWHNAMTAAAIIFAVLAIFHLFVLPAEEKTEGKKQSYRETLKSFLSLPDLGVFILFLLLFRFAEAQLAIVSRIFLLDPAGAALSLERYTLLVGTGGVAAMLAGGVTGGVFAARTGLKHALIPMALMLNVPDVLYLLWAFFPIDNIWIQGTFIAVEQFGYGFGFTGYMLIMIYLAGRCGAFQTTIFSYLTCLMILGLRLPGLFSGKILVNLNRWLGLETLSLYQSFFSWVMIATVASFAVTIAVRKKIPAEYGINTPKK